MNTEKGLGKRTLLFYIGIVVLMLVLSALSFVTYRQQLNETLADKTRQDMANYTDQSTLLFRGMLDGYFRQLETVALFCSSNGGIGDEQVINMLRSNNDGNDYVRIGVSDLRGNLYTGMDRVIDISKQDYYQRAAAGERVISNVVENPYNGRDTLVLAMPVVVEGMVEGTAIAQYDVQMFTELLGNSQFKGSGATMVMQKDGRMLSGFEGMENYATLYDALAVMEFRGADTLESLARRVGAGESGCFTYYNYGKGRYLCFQPTGVNDYVMISLVAAESMDKQLRSISAQAFVLMVKNVLFYCVILVCIWGIFRVVRRLIWNIQKDRLTQVYNKVSAHAMMEQYLRRRGKGLRHACLFLDIDNFKAINDSYGHGVGDQVLVGVTQLLRRNFRSADIVSRFGGDEFLIWMKDIPIHETACCKAANLCRELQIINGIPISVSIGIAYYPDNGATCDAVMEHADNALYEAKVAGKNRFAVYDPTAPTGGTVADIDPVT